MVAALDRGIKELKAADYGNRTLKEHKPAALFDRLNKAIWIGTVGTTPVSVSGLDTATSSI